jgi:hypothetical protein
MSTGYAGAGQETQQLNNWGADAVAGAGYSNDVFDPLADIDSGEGGMSAGKIEIEGAYHLEIADADLKRDESGQIAVNRNGRAYFNLRLVVLHSTPGLSPAGSSMWHELELPSQEDATATFPNGGNIRHAVIRSINTFCVGVGLFTVRPGPDGKPQVIDPATNSTNVQQRTLGDRLKGRQFIGRPTRRDWAANPDKGTKAGFEMQFKWGVGASQICDPQNALIPICEETAAAMGYHKFKTPAVAAPAATANPGGPAKPAAKKGGATHPPAQQPKPPADFGDL